jgi:hypothetical protein
MAPRRKDRRAELSPPRAESANAIELRRCPRCGKNTLIFAPSVAVIVQPAPSRRLDDDSEDRKLRLQYKPAWLCRHEKCRHVRLLEESRRRKA